MNLLNFFLSRKTNTANIAKERLQIIVAERRGNNNNPNYLPKLKKEILEVISKYIKVNSQTVSIQFDQKEKNISILELNVILSE